MNFTRIVNEYGPEVGAMATLLFVAAVELVCDFGSGEYAVACIARPAASSFFVLAVLLAWSIVRYERRRSTEA
jgi:hypothetical protein